MPDTLQHAAVSMVKKTAVVLAFGSSLQSSEKDAGAGGGPMMQYMLCQRYAQKIMLAKRRDTSFCLGKRYHERLPGGVDMTLKLFQKDEYKYKISRRINWTSFSC